MKNIVILISGRGSNMEAIVRACQREGWPARIAAVISNKPDAAGLDFARMKARAQTRGFRAVPMGRLTGSLTLETSAEQRTTYNVVGVLPGRVRPNETIIYAAHWDHLGRCPAVDGDDICNGALDNATGTAALIELARRYSAQGAPERSVAFIALTAEEQGLLGALYYSQHPLFSPRDTVATRRGRKARLASSGVISRGVQPSAMAAAQASFGLWWRSAPVASSIVMGSAECGLAL